MVAMTGVMLQGQFQKNNMGSSFVGVVATPQSPSHVVSHVKWRGD